mgnify:FL=1
MLAGEFLARKREEKGPPGDAYKGQWVIRANTTFNKYGDDAPGGIAVFDEDVKPVEALNRDVIYRGCYVSAKVSLANYEDDKTGAHGIKCYLVAVQKIGDGEPLSSPADHSSAFKPVGRAAAAAAGATTTRRQRKQ